jgi:hypothetical protein
MGIIPNDKRNNFPSDIQIPDSYNINEESSIDNDDIYKLYNPEAIFFRNDIIFKSSEGYLEINYNVTTNKSGNSNLNETKNKFSVKIEYKPYFEKEINQIINKIINKMDLNKENNEKFLLNPNYNNIYIQNIKEILTKNNIIRRINKNQDNIIKKVEKKNNIGRKKKNDNSKCNHNKYIPDNIVKKIKNRISDFLIEFTNNLINSIYNINEINKILLNLNLHKFKLKNQKKIIKKIEHKFSANLTKKEDNLKLLNSTLKEYLSNKISTKYVNYKENQNELIISKLLEDDENKDIFKFVFQELKIEDWLQIYTYQKNIDDYIYRYYLSKEKDKIKKSIVGIDEYLKKLITLENENYDKLYYHCFLLLIYNFRLYLDLKEGRNHKK